MNQTHPDGSGPANSDVRGDFVDVIGELASIAIDESPPEAGLRRVAQLAKQALPEVKDVSLTLVEDGRPRTVVFTSALAVDLDERQHELGFGPCLDAARSGQIITVADGAPNSPYRAFAAIAARAGVPQTISVGD